MITFCLDHEVRIRDSLTCNLIKSIKATSIFPSLIDSGLFRVYLLSVLQVYDSNMAVSAVDDYNTSTRSLSAAALRNILGTRNLGEILSER